MIPPLRSSVLIAAFLLLPTGVSAAQVLAGPVSGVVERVVDGDTLAVRVTVWIGQEVEVLVRLRGIDAPELRARCAEERVLAVSATQRLSALIAGQPIVLRAIEGDKYFGRVVADVTTMDGADLGAALTRSGSARPYAGGRREGWCAAQGGAVANEEAFASR